MSSRRLQNCKRSITALCVIAMLVACGGKPNAPAAGEAESHEAHTEEGDEHASDEAEHADAPEQTRIAAQTAEAAGVRVAASAPGVIADEHEVQGLLTPVEGRVAKVMARFPGPIRALRANVGDPVRAGQALAVDREQPEPDQLHRRRRRSRAWCWRATPRSAPSRAKACRCSRSPTCRRCGSTCTSSAPTRSTSAAGVPVTVTRMSDGVTVETTLERVLPGTATASQSTVARATIDNLDGLWRPGSAVQGARHGGRSSRRRWWCR